MEMKPQYRIVFIYLVVGVMWIFFSDAVVDAIFQNRNMLILAQRVKGWFFIFITAALLFSLIRRDFNHINSLNGRLLKSYDTAVTGWIRVMDLRHEETKNHTLRVTAMTLALAKLAGIHDKQKLKQIERGAMLHDVGKVGIPDGTLLKPGSLDVKEWEQMKTHCQIAYDLMSETEFLSDSVAIPYCHHEKWDGTGYPQGLKAEQIPIEARIFAIIDVWDALIHPRVYKNAWPEEKVLKHLQEQAGKHFDGRLVKIFLDNYEEIRSHSDLAPADTKENIAVDAERHPIKTGISGLVVPNKRPQPRES